MIKINLNPVNANHIEGFKQLEMSWNDPVLTVNDVEYDLSLIPDGAIVEHEVLLKTERTGNDFETTVMFQLGANPPQEACFPVPIEITSNGVVPVPLCDIVPEQIEEPIIEEPTITIDDEVIINDNPVE